MQQQPLHTAVLASPPCAQPPILSLCRLPEGSLQHTDRGVCVCGSTTLAHADRERETKAETEREGGRESGTSGLVYYGHTVALKYRAEDKGGPGRVGSTLWEPTCSRIQRGDL